LDMKNERIRNIAYWTTTIFGPASFVIGGVLNLTQSEQVVSTMHHLGYPAYFASVLGMWKLLGAIAIVVPGFRRLKEWAYAGFFFDLTSAAISRAAAGDSAADVAAPLIFLALVLVSWALRPASRTLVAPPVDERVFVDPGQAGQVGQSRERKAFALQATYGPGRSQASRNARAAAVALGSSTTL
jgi:uncharacterized membrane protein YphA (DoxX/SURF4 family)